MNIGNIGIETGFGVFIGKQTSILEFPTENCYCEFFYTRLSVKRFTIDNEDYSLGLRSILGLRDICLQPSDLFHTAYWLPVMYFST